MPVAQPRRDERIIDLFLSAYENNSWKDAPFIRPEQFEDKAVEIVATRKSDGLTLAIEHTIIEPFVGEKGDLAKFWPAFEKLQKDRSFFVPDRITRVFVPVGILDGQKANSRQAIVDGVAAWLRANIASLPNGWSKPKLKIRIPGKSDLETVLNIQVILTPNFSSFKIARQQMGVNLDQVVAKALETKLPKLVKTKADKRILMLERQHMNLMPDQIILEIERVWASFPDLEKVKEIWLAETQFYETDDAIHFEMYDEKGGGIAGLGFFKGKVNSRWDHTMPYGVAE